MYYGCGTKYERKEPRRNVIGKPLEIIKIFTEGNKTSEFCSGEMEGWEQGTVPMSRVESSAMDRMSI